MTDNVRELWYSSESESQTKKSDQNEGESEIDQRTDPDGVGRGKFSAVGGEKILRRLNS